MAITELDRDLLERCLGREAGAWKEFVNRFLGLISHVVTHTAYCRSVPLTAEDIEDLCAEILLQVIADDYAVLRRFRGQASLATYLTVIARRVCVRELVRRNFAAELGHLPARLALAPKAEQADLSLERIADAEEVESMLQGLNRKESQIVRMFHLEERSYREIAETLNIPENSIGPTLHRALQKLRRRAETRSSARSS